MNKLLTGIVLLCFSIGAIAQEKQIWACQQEAGTILHYDWEDDRWKSRGVSNNLLLLTIDGASSSYKIGDREMALVCSEEFEVLVRSSVTSCANNVGAEQILLDSNSGRMGMSYLFGALIRLDDVAAQIYNCTKF